MGFAPRTAPASPMPAPCLQRMGGGFCPNSLRPMHQRRNSADLLADCFEIALDSLKERVGDGAGVIGNKLKGRPAAYEIRVGCGDQRHGGAHSAKDQMILVER